MKKICLIVDNPARDIEGLVLLTLHLAEKNIEVFLVPMYFLNEVFYIKPDFVLLNYIRPENKTFVEQCKKYGISTGVMDTEGGVLQNYEKYFSYARKNLGIIDLYATWGNRQVEALNTENNATVFRVTGCPRYDFCVSPWSNALPELTNIKNSFILVNTNFALALPRFQSPEKEIEVLVREGFKRKDALEFQRQDENAAKEMIKAIKFLAGKFPKEEFVIRPHPFERKSFYDENLKGIQNVQVRQEGSVFSWVRNSKILLHFNCSTSFEAILFGIEPVHFGWIKAPMLDQKMVHGICQFPKSLDDAELIIRKVVDGERIEVSNSIIENRKKLIEEVFCSADGDNSLRLANSICEYVENKKNNTGSSNYWVDVVLDYLFKRQFKKFLIYFFKGILGSVKYQKWKNLLLRKGKSGKEFDSGDVSSIIERLSNASRESKILFSEIRVEGRAGTNKPMCSVKVFKKF